MSYTWRTNGKIAMLSLTSGFRDILQVQADEQNSRSHTWTHNSASTSPCVYAPYPSPSFITLHAGTRSRRAGSCFCDNMVCRRIVVFHGKEVDRREAVFQVSATGLRLDYFADIRSKANLIDSRFAPAWIAFAHSFAWEGEHDHAITAYSTSARLFPG